MIGTVRYHAFDLIITCPIQEGIPTGGAAQLPSQQEAKLVCQILREGLLPMSIS